MDKKPTLDEIIKAYEMAIKTKSTEEISLKEQKEFGNRKSKKKLLETKRSPREIITEAFVKDPELVLEDDVNGISFKVKAIESNGVRVVDTETGKVYFFPWNVFES